MMRGFSLFLFFFLNTYSGQAAGVLDVKVDPSNPQLDKIFRVTAMAMGEACESIQKIVTNFPASWLVTNESKIKKDGGCLVVEVVSSSKEEKVAWSGFQLSLLGGRTLSGGASSISVGKLAAAEVEATGEKDLETYLKSLQDFLSAYVLGGEIKEDQFSIESCRIPLEKVVKVFLRLSQAFVWDYKFKPRCDVEGQGEIRLDTPVPFDLKILNLGSIDRIKGIAVTKAVKSAGFQLKVDTLVDEGELLSASKTKMKFSLTHTRTVALNLQRFSLTDVENEGMLSVTEFEGKPMAYKKPFMDQRYLKLKDKR